MLFRRIAVSTNMFRFTNEAPDDEFSNPNTFYLYDDSKDAGHAEIAVTECCKHYDLSCLPDHTGATQINYLEIYKDFRGQGYGRFLFEAVCENEFSKGNIVVVEDTTNGIGDTLYCGEKTRKIADVFCLLSNSKTYILTPRSGDIRDIIFLAINDAHIHDILRISIYNLPHLNRYLQQHPNHAAHLGTDMLPQFVKLIEFLLESGTEAKKSSLKLELCELAKHQHLCPELRAILARLL